MAGKRFLGKVASKLCRYPVGQKFHRNRSISLRFRDKRVFAFYAEIQDGRQKWPENDFLGKPLIDSADTLWAKNFVEIALSRSVSEINTFLHFTQKFKMAAKSGGKTLFCKTSPVDSPYTLWVKNFIKIALSCSVSEINTFFAFYAEIQDGCQKWRENDFWEKSLVESPNTFRVKNFVEIALSRSVSEINKKIDVMILLQIRK